MYDFLKYCANLLPRFFRAKRCTTNVYLPSVVIDPTVNTCLTLILLNNFLLLSSSIRIYFAWSKSCDSYLNPGDYAKI